MTMQVLVTPPGGAQTDMTAKVQQTGWKINQDLGAKGDTATFFFRDEVTSPSALSFVLKPLSQIVVKDTTINKVLFGGLITKPTLKQIGATLLEWQVDCRDYTTYADNAIVPSLDIQNLTADVALKNAIANAGVGGEFTTNNVHSAPMITRLRASYKQLSTLWTDLATLSSTTSEYGWYVDENKDVHFFNANQVAASGLVITDANPTANDTATVAHVDRDQSQYSWDGTSVRNRVYVRGGAIITTFTDTFVGNGWQTSWPLSFAPDPSQSASKLTLTVKGTSQSVILVQGAGVNTSGYAYKVEQTKNGWYLQTVGASTPVQGAVIKLAYRASSNVTTQADGAASQAAYGIFATALLDPSIMDVSTAKMRALRELQQYGSPYEVFDCVIPEQWPGHVRSGQVVNLTMSWVPDSQNSWNAGLTNVPFLITHCEIAASANGGNYRTYHLTLVRLGLGA